MIILNIYSKLCKFFCKSGLDLLIKIRYLRPIKRKFGGDVLSDYLVIIKNTLIDSRDFVD